MDKVLELLATCSGLNGVHPTTAIGHLIAIAGNCAHFFVSEAVMRAVVDKCEVLAAVYENCAFNRWMFEVHF